MISAQTCLLYVNIMHKTVYKVTYTSNMPQVQSSMFNATFIDDTSAFIQVIFQTD